MTHFLTCSCPNVPGPVQPAACLRNATLLRLVHNNKNEKDVTLELLEDMGVNLIEDNSNEASAQEPVNSNPKINLNLILKVSEYE